MTDMKCPFCNSELLLSSFRMGEEDYQMWNCLSCEFSANRIIWDKIIRTRKALACAKSKLNGIHRLYSKAFYTREDWLQVCMEIVDKANTALEQITALEQKDIK